jgi:2-amino-4-hydroxy-6-hydroxymethyldihydropteridine diphosphokinase
VEKIRALKNTKILKLSRIRESEPLGGPANQGKFLNAALKIQTSLSPLSLLKQLKIIEKVLGRKKTVRWGPRLIDLDILFYGDKFIQRGDLKIPHPRLFEREFVLKPLVEVI